MLITSETSREIKKIPTILAASQLVNGPHQNYDQNCEESGIYQGRELTISIRVFFYRL